MPTGTAGVDANSSDSGMGSLRAALTAAQLDNTASIASPHVIDFSALAPSATISLLSRITLHNTHVDLYGLGMNDLVLDASGFSDTIFSVEDLSPMTLRGRTTWPRGPAAQSPPR